jgi:hypothetical protein
VANGRSGRQRPHLVLQLLALLQQLAVGGEGLLHGLTKGLGAGVDRADRTLRAVDARQPRLGLLVGALGRRRQLGAALLDALGEVLDLLGRLARARRQVRTSSATTAKPLPCSPARAASTAALSASRLVWNAMTRSCR